MLGLVLAHATAAQAQIRLGVGAGLNFTSIDDISGSVSGISARTAYENRSGWHLGIFVDMAAGPVALRPGLYYILTGPIFQDGVPMGGSGTGTPPPNADPDDFDLAFITIPVDLRLRLSLPVLTPYVFAGPEFRLLQDAEIGEGFRDNLKTFTFAGNVGLGAEVHLLGLDLMPELRYAFDMSGITGDVIDFRGVEFIADGEERHKTRAVMLRLGLVF